MYPEKVLLTTHSLIDFAGAEMNIFSLAMEFKERGCHVEIATFQYGQPINVLFDENNISVINIITQETAYKFYDLIWVQHAPTINKILFEKDIVANRIIFSSLSPFEPLEAPPIYINQLNLCLANSYETRDKLLLEQVEPSRILIFPNFAPSSFIKSAVLNNNPSLERVCIVSNHVPQEVLEAVGFLEEMDIKVDVFGIMHQQVAITPEVLERYDAVITIGKTVQYSLVMGIPVFCYDVHGGPGWIDSTNYETAKYYNFSGRGFNNKYKAKELFKKIISGYDKALNDIGSLKLKANSEFDLSTNLDSLIDKLKDTEQVNINSIKKVFFLVDRQNKSFMREYEYNNYRKGLVVQHQDHIKELNVSADQSKELIEQLQYREERVKKQLDETKDILKSQSDELFKLKDMYSQLEQKFNELLDMKAMEINQMEQVLKKKENELQQKENNCNYLSELVEEKNQIIFTMTNTFAWKSAEKLRNLKLKTKKVIKNPRLILKKLRRRNSDFGVPLNIEGHVNVTGTQNPLVSVVIPIYDRTDVLISSIDSILNQTYENIELLLVCDGSPEETLKVVFSYKNHPKVRIFHFKNNSGNAVRGRNKAIKEAKGEFLAFQDSDDIAEPDRIENSILYIKQFNVDVVYGGWRALIDGSRKIDLQNNQEIFSPDCDYELLKEICVPCQSTVMVRTEALRTVGGLKPIMKYREDHELWLRLAYYNYKFKSIPKVLTNLRLHENNLELSFKGNDSHWEKLTIEEHTVIRPLKPKIAYVVGGCGISGGLAVICQHANGLLKRGYDVLILTEDNSTSIDWFPNQLVPVVPIHETPDNLDIVVATYWTTAYTVENIPAKYKYYFIQSDESRFFETGSKEQIAASSTYTKAFELMTMANWIKEWLKSEFNRDAHYVPNGVDLNVMHETIPLIERTGKLRVLLEGPIDVPFKNMQDAFKVVEDLDCEVWCISTSGKPDPSWKCDKFFEKVPMEKMKNIYSSCDVLLKMSSVESFCLPALEMMACGGTCVLNRFKGLDEFVIDNHNGLIVELGDIAGAKAAIQKLIENPALLQQLRTNALETAKHWGWERSISELERVFAN